MFRITTLFLLVLFGIICKPTNGQGSLIQTIFNGDSAELSVQGNSGSITIPPQTSVNVNFPINNNDVWNFTSKARISTFQFANVNGVFLTEDLLSDQISPIYSLTNIYYKFGLTSFGTPRQITLSSIVNQYVTSVTITLNGVIVVAPSGSTISPNLQVSSGNTVFTTLNGISIDVFWYYGLFLGSVRGLNTFYSLGNSAFTIIISSNGLITIGI